MIVICGNPTVGNGTVYVHANGTVYEMDGRVNPPKPDHTVFIEGRPVDGAEWWFESARERSH